MNQTICDRCKKVGGRATVKWMRYMTMSIWPEKRDLCKDCFNELFPKDWKL